MEATIAIADRLARLIGMAARNGGHSECPDEETFRYLLQEGGTVNAVKNVPHDGGLFKTQCVLQDPTTGQMLYFCVYTDQPVDW